MTFDEYLREQVTRDGPVGELARSVMGHKRRYTPPRLFEYLMFDMCAHDRLFSARAQAEQEWKELRRQMRRGQAA